jgi:hypothetical protein
MINRRSTMPVNLRNISREELLRLGKVASYGWKDRETGTVWPALKLREKQTLIMWDGHLHHADAGDYIVKCENKPHPVYGVISYFAHETQLTVMPVARPPAFFKA